MSNVLEKIVADKRQELAKRKVELPLNSFIDGLMPSDRSFYDALSQPKAGYIFECKKASPSKGLIRDNFDLDEIISAYAPYAACISVLTDEKYFQGKFEYLSYVRQRVSQPVINKDFFVDPYQIYLARYHQADAVLLMLSVLDDAEYQQLSLLADKFNLDVLTEVSNEEEVIRAVNLKAKIIGINNRDLRDLSTDLATTERLVPLIKQLAEQQQHECLIISESGIYTHQDVRRLAPLVNGFLVGSSVMAQTNLTDAIHQLIYGRVKVCGITNANDAQTVKDSGASLAGLIFASQSKRHVDLQQALQIVSAVPFNYVGVFVNQSVRTVVEYANQLNLFGVQLHGEEDQSYVDNLRRQLPDGCKIIKAYGVVDALPEQLLNGTDYTLLDCKVGQQSGGTGQQFDWQLLASAQQHQNIILAGGINPANVVLAANTGVGILDLNSGVEDQPGHKSQTKIKQAIAALREY